MNASLARRIRNAEAILIAAIDRNKTGRREWSQHQTAQPHQHEARFSGPIRYKNRVACLTRARSCDERAGCDWPI
jgi:hypothetical protein